MSIQRPGLDFAFGSPGSSRDFSLAIFYAVRNRPAVDLRFLLRECERLLDEAGWCAAERSDAQALGLFAIHAFMGAHERRLPTTKEYEAWRKSPEAPGGLVPESNIRRAFGGSWKAAIRAAERGAPVDVVAARQLRAAGSAFTHEELAQAIRDFAAGSDVSVARWADYRRWSGDMLEADPNRRLPSSRHAFRKLGGFRAVCRLVGVETLMSGLSAEHRHYDEGDLVDALRRAWEECECPSRLTKPQFAACRLKWQQDALQRGESAAFPAAETIVDTFGSWANALLAAEIIDRKKHKRIAGRQRTKHIDTETGLRFLMDALSEKGPLLGPSAYDRWRDSHCESGAVGPPSRAWLASRFGSYDEARKIALARLRDERGTDGGTS